MGLCLSQQAKDVSVVDMTSTLLAVQPLETAVHLQYVLFSLPPRVNEISCVAFSEYRAVQAVQYDRAAEGSPFM